ncbi:MAG: YqeG family HAD IIIA-type phosphatase [Candidatus Saganbacteria bacterium]|nr:YqeG family HAD IIIA-type phosphatase [Candidatus Saganbacteria bacterium]
MNGWFKPLKPDQIVNNIQEIDFTGLKQAGIKALILDIDDTLIPRRMNDVTPEVLDWVNQRKAEGFRLFLASNSRHPSRVNYFSETLGVPAAGLGLKPLPFAFRRALKTLQAAPAEAAMIGDQLFTDILGANMLGIYTIFVKHLTPETFSPRVWMRQAEKWVLDRL